MKRAIEAFGEWFGSAAGVLQTAVVSAVVIAAELAFPRVDPHMFWWLVVLTIYSGVTQPVLAYVGMRGAAKTDKVLDCLEAMEQRELDKTDTLLALLAGRGSSE